MRVRVTMKRFIKRNIFALISLNLFIVVSISLFINVKRNSERSLVNNNVIDENIPDEIVEYLDTSNNSDIRSEWKFKITKNYRRSLLYEYHAARPVKVLNITAPGENGSQVIHSPHFQALRDEMFKLQNFDLLASNMISVKRSLPEARPLECIGKAYPPRLPKASVVIIFHNEAWSAMIRTLWSIVNRSPKELLQEIVLVDDASTNNELKNMLDDYLSMFPAKVKMIRNEKRQGLIRARLIGAKYATGNVLIFLDAHMECNAGWMEPLLTRIATDRSVIAVPMLDWIRSANMAYIPVSTRLNTLRWNLIFDWMNVPDRELIRVNNDKTAPVRTPTLVGCAFAVDKEFFYEIGSFDEGMNIWGGENVEMSFRVWQCGGFMEVIPCSHVGHLYRISTYSFEGDKRLIKYQNNVRAVEVWMDEYKKFYYAASQTSIDVDPGDLSDRIEFRNRMKCEPFSWYLEHIYPEHIYQEYQFLGAIQSSDLRCLDSYDGKRVQVNNCHFLGGFQMFSLNRFNQIITSFGKCLCESRAERFLTFCACDKGNENIKWDYNETTKSIIHKISRKCLFMDPPNFASLQTCNQSDAAMHWSIVKPKSRLTRTDNAIELNDPSLFNVNKLK